MVRPAHPPHRPRVLRTLTAAALMLPAIGCRGRADVTLIPLNTRQLSASKPLQFEFPARQCLWWKNGAGNTVVVMRYRNISALGDLTRDTLALSLVLAGEIEEGETTITGRQELGRAIWHRGPFHLRMRAARGAVALRLEAGDTLTGQFRLQCTAARFDVLRGWLRQSPVLLQGRFRAVFDPQGGADILQATEEGQPRQTPDPAVTFVPGG